MATIGETLRAARERRGLSLSEASRLTRIAPRFLVALEEDDYGALPAPVYARGFLRSYATLLGLEPEPLVAALRHIMEPPQDVVGFEESERLSAEPPTEPAASTGPSSRWRSSSRRADSPSHWTADVLMERDVRRPAWGWLVLFFGTMVFAVGLFALALALCRGDEKGSVPSGMADSSGSRGSTVVAMVTSGGEEAFATATTFTATAQQTPVTSASGPTPAVDLDGSPTTPAVATPTTLVVPPTPTNRPPTGTPTPTPTPTPT